MEKAFLTVLITATLFLVPELVPTTFDVAFAQQYGVGAPQPSLVITINKQIMHPKTGVFVENLGVNDPKFTQEQVVTFKITIANTGNTQLNNVTVKDTLPQFVTFGTGPGKMDGRTLTMTLGTLEAGKSSTQTFTTKVVPADQLPADKAVACVQNVATVTGDSQLATAKSDLATDTAQFCIEKVVAPVTKGGLKVFPPPTVGVTPPTGPEALGLIALIPSSIVGYLLRRKTIRR